MLRNYFLVAWRNLSRHRLNAGINVLGLSVAFMCSILLFLMVHREFSVDQFHKNKASLYEVYSVSHAPDGDEKGTAMGYPVAPTLLSEVPGVIKATGLMDVGNLIRYKDKEIEKEIRVVDNDFFSMFTFPTVAGASANPLASTGNVVLSQSTADALFGKENPIGKVVKVKVNNDWKDLVVTAVLRDAGENSSVEYDVLARIELSSEYAKNKNSWNSQNHNVFIQLAPGISPAVVEKELRGIRKKYLAVDEKDLKSRGYRADANGDLVAFKLYPFANNHFNTEFGYGDVINKTYLYTLMLIAVVVMVIACFNFINLNVARAFTRAKEVGIRKTIGAGKRQIFLQLWAESFLLCVVALLIGMLAAYALLVPFNDLFTEKLRMTELLNPGVAATIVSGMVLVSFLAGGYPAWMVARFGVVEVLKGKLTVTRSSLLRNGLITFQFVMATLLICSTIVIYRQFQHLRNAPLGFEQESVISIPVKDGSNTRRYIDQLRTRLSGQPQVVSVSGVSSNIGLGTDGGTGHWHWSFNYQSRVISTAVLAVDYDFFSTVGIKPLTGRTLDRAYSSSRDTSSSMVNVVVSESLYKQFQQKDVLGLSFYADSSAPKWNIVGVVPDIHFYSMYEKSEPLAFLMGPTYGLGYILVKVRTTNPMQAMNLVKTTYRAIEPANTYSPTYLTENTRRWYESEQRLSSIFFSAAAIAILLSCLGLFAIVTLVLEQRRKEIGVRKVLGASMMGITGLLSRDFLKLIVLAFVIAVPIGTYFLNQWLQNFIYRTTLSWWIFAVAGLVSVVIAMLTIGIQTVRAALANPVESLRSE
jgi:putative ABC transport system permease protein